MYTLVYYKLDNMKDDKRDGVKTKRNNGIFVMIINLFAHFVH